MISVGFVGLGLIGSRRLEFARARPSCRVAFAIDPDLARRAAFALDGCHLAATIDAFETINDEFPDAVFVAVPHHEAAKAARWALSRGAHVLCEKPLGLDLAEARSVAALALAKGKKLCTGFNYRYLSGVQALRDLLRDRSLGTIYRLRMMMGHGGRPGMEREWKLKKAYAGGGALIDPGIHLIDLARFFFGEARAASSLLQRRFWASDVEDFCAVSITCDGIDVAIEVSLTSWRNQFSIEVCGSEGMVRLEGRGGNYGTQRLEFTNRWFWQDGADRRISRDLGSDDNSFLLETAAFLDWVEHGRYDGMMATADDGCAALQLVEELYAGAQ
jgi:predicted dehydrogenase